MTRRCYDSINVASLPAGADIYAGYDDGKWPDAAAILARFHKTTIRITVNPNDNEGDCLDVESGDATPAQAPAWVVKRRAAGHGGPLVYCSWSALPAVKDAFNVAKVPFPGFWVAGYPAPDGDAIPPGCVGHQWIDHGPYDESIFQDYLPGIDPAAPAPTPPPPPPWTYTGDMPATTDVVDSWSVPGSSGLAYVELHADGGLFGYGSVTPSALEYIAESNDGGRYAFGPGKNGGVLSYPGLPANERQGSRYFVKLVPLRYNGKDL